MKRGVMQRLKHRSRRRPLGATHGVAGRYNLGMIARIANDMAQYIGFGAADAENIRALRPYLLKHVSDIVERFYEALDAHPGARAVLEGPEQLNRLKQTLSQWIESLLSGDYDENYWSRRARIGQVHVEVQLPQHYMFCGMEVLWGEFQRITVAEGVPEAPAKLRSLHKLLTLEVGVMLETYKDNLSQKVRSLERSAVHEQLHRAEQLAQIGQLAASLAHEIKNPLAGISGAIQIMRDATPPDDPHQPILAEILRQVTRLDGTVKDLLIYARPKPPSFEQCRINELCERVVTMLLREPKLRRISFRSQLQADLPTIQADEAQIEQVLINLLLNAADASRENGVVRLTSSNTGGNVEIRVIDEGVGMDEQTVQRAFEPFFTLKSKGTGLGLPICQKIVEAHGGEISVRSEPGLGTTVVVRLPQEPRKDGLR
ncbi:MAG: hypothetical protein D6744_17875 [Planctomycetota bacterium]|nr:MAG: hypothetical protein D6744_17875 [Planctomycetota bacterium]